MLLRDDVLRGDEVRVAYTWLARHDSERLVLMQMAETKGKRSTLATEIIKGVMVPQFVILPLAVLLVWLALVRGIRPLNDLEQRIRARKPDDLSPIEDSFVPQEGGTAGVVDQRPAQPPQSLADDAEAFPGRRRAPAQDAAGGIAHAGRTGAARDRSGRDPGLAAADCAIQHARHPRQVDALRAAMALRRIRDRQAGIGDHQRVAMAQAGDHAGTVRHAARGCVS